MPPCLRRALFSWIMMMHLSYRRYVLIATWEGQDLFESPFTCSTSRPGLKSRTDNFVHRSVCMYFFESLASWAPIAPWCTCEIADFSIHYGPYIQKVFAVNKCSDRSMIVKRKLWQKGQPSHHPTNQQCMGIWIHRDQISKSICKLNFENFFLFLEVNGIAFCLQQFKVIIYI